MRSRLVTVMTTLIITFLIQGIIISVYGDVLFQEGNPAPIIKAIGKLETGDVDYVEISGTPIKYISKSRVDREKMIREYMSDLGWTYKEQMGSGYFFERDGVEGLVNTKQWTGKYFIWTVPGEQTLDS